MSPIDNLLALLESIVISIPTDNVLGIVYVILNLVLQIGAILLGGETGSIF